ncbi:MAG: peptide chain release factor N(5)-glutamine methyltransferase [Parvibaculales bacterium]
MANQIIKNFEGLSREAALRQLSTCFEAAKLASPALDARVLLRTACGCDEVELIARGEMILSAQEAQRLDHMMAQRLARKPVSRILNHREFYGLPFRLSPATLDPRPDSEILVSVMVDKYRQASAQTKQPKVLDLGTGSGCLLLAFLHEVEQAQGLGVDQSRGAIRQACINASCLNLRARASFRQSNWFAAVRGKFDFIMANPPYIARCEEAQLAPEVRLYDPALALFADENGLSEYRHIIEKMRHFCAPYAWVGFEIGQGQASKVVSMLQDDDWQGIEIHKDLSGIERVIVAQNTQIKKH